MNLKLNDLRGESNDINVWYVWLKIQLIGTDATEEVK